MARMYTFDKKLLCGSPEIRIGEKVYPIDDRKNTVKKVLKLFEDKNGSDMDKSDEALKIAFGDNYNEIEALDLSFKAYQELAEMVIAAMTGEEPEDFEKRREEENQSFRDKQVV